jgi:hypothetical protein
MNEVQFREKLGAVQRRAKATVGQLTDADIFQIGGDQNKFDTAIQSRYGERMGEVTKWGRSAVCRVDRLV